MTRRLLGVLVGLILLGLLTVGLGCLLGARPQAREQAPAAVPPTPTPLVMVTETSTTTIPTRKPLPTLTEAPPGPGTPRAPPRTPTPTTIPTTPTPIPPLARTSAVITISVPEADFGKQPTGETAVVSAPWGTGEGQFGRGPSRGGPNSLTVDDQGRIYVVDVVNARIQGFSPDGKYLASYPIHKGVTDIVFDGGFFYLADVALARTVGKYDANMRLLKEFPIAREISLVPSAGALYVRGASVYVESLGDQSNPGPFLYRIAAADAPIPVSEQPKWRVPGRPAAVGDGYLSAARPDKTTAIIRTYSPTWEIVNEVALHFETPASAGFGWILHQDAGGNVYLPVFFALPGPERFEGGINRSYRSLLVVVSPQGQLVRAVPLPTTGNFTDVQRGIVIGPGGEVYQLRTFESGVKVVRWP